MSLTLKSLKKTIVVDKNCGFPSLCLSFSFQAAGQPTTLWRSTEKHKVHGRNPIPVLTRLSANHVLHSVSGSLHPLQFSNQWRFIMGAKHGSGDSLKKKKRKKKHSPCLCHLICEWNLDLIGPRTSTDSVSSCSQRERRRLLWGDGHVEKKTQ